MQYPVRIGIGYTLMAWTVLNDCVILPQNLPFWNKNIAVGNATKKNCMLLLSISIHLLSSSSSFAQDKHISHIFNHEWPHRERHWGVHKVHPSHLNLQGAAGSVEPSKPFVTPQVSLPPQYFFRLLTLVQTLWTRLREKPRRQWHSSSSVPQCNHPFWWIRTCSEWQPVGIESSWLQVDIWGSHLPFAPEAADICTFLLVGRCLMPSLPSYRKKLESGFSILTFRVSVGFLPQITYC